MKHALGLLGLWPLEPWAGHVSETQCPLAGYSSSSRLIPPHHTLLPSETLWSAARARVASWTGEGGEICSKPWVGFEGGHAGTSPGQLLEAGQRVGVWRQGTTLWTRAARLYLLTTEGKAWLGTP